MNDTTKDVLATVAHGIIVVSASLYLNTVIRKQIAKRERAKKAAA